MSQHLSRPPRLPDEYQHDARSLRVSALLSARNLQRFTLNDVPDIRGWEVISADRQLVGTVSRLIVEMRTRRVRYLVITLDPSLERRRRASMNMVLVPVGLARPVDECLSIILEGVRSQSLQVAPRIPERPINRDDEERTLAALGLPPLGAGTEPYAGAHFDERQLLAPRH